PLSRISTLIPYTTLFRSPGDYQHCRRLARLQRGLSGDAGRTGTTESRDFSAQRWRDLSLHPCLERPPGSYSGAGGSDPPEALGWGLESGVSDYAALIRPTVTCPH